MISYAQNFEDVLLARLFHGQKEGFYVDVGAWHPTRHSVTKHFYDLGWSGINVEPLQGQFELFIEARTRDLNLNVAVAEVSGTVRFFECKDLTSLSTANEEQARELVKEGHDVESYEVPVVTLNEMLSIHNDGRTIDFLKIDVEGFEENVLRGVDLRRFRPRVLIVEATLPAVKIEDWDNIESVSNWDAWESGVLDAGYLFAWYDGLSRYYVREEESHLKRRLTLPPSVHDEFELAEVSELKSMQQALLKDREDMLAANMRLATELEVLKGQTTEDYRGKISAKEQVIDSFAIRDCERKGILRGIPDAIYHALRNPKSLGYGDYYPAEGFAKAKHVVVDTLEIVFGVSGGVETYMKMLVRALLSSGNRVTLICLREQLPVLRDIFGGRVGYFVMRESQGIRLSFRILKRLRGGAPRVSAATSMATFTRLQEDIGADVLHSPVQIFSCQDFRLPAVLNLHDLQHLHFPENFHQSDIEARNRLYKLSASLSDAVVVSSDFVRHDLIERLEIAPSKVFTVPVTWDPALIEGLGKFGVDEAVKRYQLPPLYAFYPAQFWPHKNHARLVKALSIVRKMRPEADFKLVFTGYRGHAGWPLVEAAIHENGLQSHIICLDHVPVEHLAAIYKGALYCVMPSTFEASSYPVIEAQVLGVPAMCSNVTSLPELMRDGAGLLFNPFDIDDIAATMLRWLDDAEDRRTHAARAKLKVEREHSVENYVHGLNKAYQYAIWSRQI